MRSFHLAQRVQLAGFAAVAALSVLIAAACGGAPSPITVSPSPVITVPAVAADTVVYLSLGDSIGQDCCPAFADFLTRKLGRNVQMVNMAGDGSSVDLISGVNQVRPSQLDTALATIRAYTTSGHPVVAVTLVTGRKDFQQQVASCGDPTDVCRQAFQAQFSLPFSERLAFIFKQLSSEAPSVPVFSVNYFDTAQCPGAVPATFTMADLDRTIAQVASENGGNPVDVSKTVGGCDSLTGATPAPAGISAIESAIEDAYDALPVLPT